VDEGILGRAVQEDESGDPTTSVATPTAVTHVRAVDGTSEAGMIVEIAAGSSCCVYRSISGNVFINGFFKDDDTKFKTTPSRDESVRGFNAEPVQVPLPAPAVRINSGQSAQYCAALLKDGSLVTWGMGNDGQVRGDPASRRDEVLPCPPYG